MLCQLYLNFFYQLFFFFKKGHAYLEICLNSFSFAIIYLYPSLSGLYVHGSSLNFAFK